jgi:hypothetical protein
MAVSGCLELGASVAVSLAPLSIKCRPLLLSG